MIKNGSSGKAGPAGQKGDMVEARGEVPVGVGQFS